eukprot:CAMPEP_0115326314 /NCGR_PEP_ID=MMETSP0270-20121206/83503_1 /TAXON_ID=71861 /ORGANISM="Scrippsiella trochoidea, Strain CCMP3099" /LENGTH=43 /DNA_ID= /DNA_START= /DNA_END= /DNA_ORIENTATION=
MAGDHIGVDLHEIYNLLGVASWGLPRLFNCQRRSNRQHMRKND